jgi:acyl-coenzyme A thioesterase PaaI-like protein
VGALIEEPHPDLPGWVWWRPDQPGSFFDVIGEFALRAEGPGQGRVRWFPASRLGNIRGTLHGGALLGFVDIALFAGSTAAGIAGAKGAATVDCSCQFLAPAALDRPLEAVVEVVREGGRMVFLRGIAEQDEQRILSFAGIIRKPSRP